jgi:hypothetical protein
LQVLRPLPQAQLKQHHLLQLHPSTPVAFLSPALQLALPFFLSPTCPVARGPAAAAILPCAYSLTTLACSTVRCRACFAAASC